MTENLTCLTSAMGYAARGWYVFPVAQNKRPMTKNGLKDATTEPDQLRAWWTRWPHAGVAIRTGAESGFFAVDVDPDKSGDDSLHALLEEFGALPETPRSLTGRKGMHYLFRHDGRKVKTCRDLAPGIDIRGDGGYIVAPPSLHANGRRYEWERDIDIAPAVAPDWLLEMVLDRERLPSAAPPPRAFELPMTDRVRRASAYLRRIPGAISGSGGHDQTWRAAFTVVRGFDLDTETAYSLLASEYNPRCEPPWSEKELRHKVESADKDAKVQRGYLLEREQPQPRSAGRAVELEKPRDDYLPLTDLGNAERLVAAHGTDLRYCHAWASWLAWDGRRWCRDNSGEPMRRAKAVIRDTYEAAALTHKTTEKQVQAATEAGAEIEEKAKTRLTQTAALMKWARESESRGRLTSMLDLAQSERPIPVDHETLDTDAWQLSVANGTLDLSSGELFPHRREDRITRIARVAYDRAAQAPMWLAFLDKIMLGRQDLVAFLQRMTGIALTGDVSEQYLFFLHGQGANGKGAFMRIVAELLGEYARTAAPNLLTEKRGESHPTELTDLFRARLMLASEVRPGARLAEGLVKWITGGDTITARRMNEDFWSFRPTHKVWLAANHKPVIRGTDHGIWRRILLVPFDLTVTSPDDSLEKRIADNELPGILNWALAGIRDWQSEGLCPPTVVRAASEAYRAEMDNLRSFIEDCTERDVMNSITSSELYAAYREWSALEGEQAASHAAFGRKLVEHGLQPDRIGSARTRGWKGLRLRTDRPRSEPSRKWAN